MKSLQVPGQRHGVRAYLRAPGGRLLQLLVVEALTVEGLRVFHAYGPPGQPAPTASTLLIQTDDGRPIDNLRVLVRVRTDPLDGVVRFLAPRAVERGNN